ncbi:putative bifunctional diguanylate cyclase/phosphodiesterase [Longimicrobium sp.]|uniref:putative bifunctional diguanylate cyclase/phosphodiesterase n=1 Tax=Longimicrobium sp. TaxID=2029185 RepID=UPI002E2FB37A|nr:EAL domain-containing protein [Longimicrobium sp.]HEX6041849.1 EAL domain-containing protein [Longimicrobium sp.]
MLPDTSAGALLPGGDTPEAGFERLAAFAARLLQVPVSVISLVDAERPFSAGDAGDAWRPRRETPLARSLCRFAVDAGQPLLLEDARDFPAVRQDPAVWLGEVGYAGIPFRRADGRVAGALCVADDRPRAWTPEEVDVLASLARFAGMLVASRGPATMEEALQAAAQSARRNVSLRMLRKAVETMQLGVTVTDPQGRILYSNPADAELHGYTVEELVGQNARIFAPPSAARPLPAQMHEVGSWSRETVNVRKDGSEFPVFLRSDVVRDAAGRPVGLVTCCEDLTHRKQLEHQLLRNAFYDPVTGLPNRGLLSHRLDLAIDLARREGHRFAVLSVELDRLQLVQETLGRPAADELLVAAAARLRECAPAEGMVAHVAADQFAILLDTVRGVREATRVATCVHHMLTEPFRAGGRDVFTGASVGIVLSGPAYIRAEDVLRDAGIAMMRARDTSDSEYQVFDPAMHAEAMARLHLETDLRRALERGELRVHYQPIVRLDTGRITGFEALARWEHPERGLIQPDDFIPLAEDTGLILPVGLWVLEEACRSLAGWQRRPGGERLTMAVNLSARQFSQPDLVDRVARVLRETGVHPGTLELEITESVILQHSAPVIDTLKRLKALGVALHVDDFGTGYSSLSYLHRLPLDALKIDRSFVSGADAGSLQIVRTIVAMAHALGVVVVTEGIETAELLGELRSLNCEYGQGFFFSRPVAGEAVAALLETDLSW